MADINLLPIDLSPSKGSVKAAKGLQKITLMLGGLFLTTLIIGIIIIVLLTTQLNSSSQKISLLKQNVQALVGTEQNLFLIKDRLDKIKSATAGIGSESNYQTVNSLLENLPQGVSINGIDINSSKTEFSIISTSSLGMANFLNFLTESSGFKILNLTNFTFDKTNGYTITFQIS